MPRIGWNPARGKTTDYRPARVTLAMLTYVPSLSGYFETRFQALKLSLESLIVNTPEPHGLLVFDNGSCKDVVNYLVEYWKNWSAKPYSSGSSWGNRRLFR
jgi:hypothetical protein